MVASKAGLPAREVSVAGVGVAGVGVETGTVAPVVEIAAVVFALVLKDIITGVLAFVLAAALPGVVTIVASMGRASAGVLTVRATAVGLDARGAGIETWAESGAVSETLSLGRVATDRNFGCVKGRTEASCFTELVI